MEKNLIRLLLPCIFMCIIIIISTIQVRAQNTGIGTTNPQNKLHIAGGLRIDTLVSGIDSGLLRHDKSGAVYSLKFTNNSGDVLRGDGKFSSLGGNSGAWLLNGNTGTNPLTQFLGTTDDVPLKFRINNIAAGEISHGNGITSLGYSALISNTTGILNSAFGKNALFSNALVKGMQEHQLQIEKLQQENDALKKDLELIKKKLGM